MSFEKAEYQIHRLYKYRPDNKHTLDIIKHRELYFSFTKDFNDPFDSRVIVAHFSGNKSQWAAMADKFDIPKDIRQRGIQALESLKYDGEQFHEFYKRYTFKTYIAYCMSEKKDNILMWGHYTNCHRGICLGFETTSYRNSLCIRMNDPKLESFLGGNYSCFLPIEKVEYQSDYPEPYDIFLGETRKLISFLLTKGKDWEYEQERRVILPYAEIKSQVLHFDVLALKEVILARLLPFYIVMLPG